MPVFVKDDKSILFVHVPKTGGTTIEKALKSSGWLTHMRETGRTHPRMMAVRRCSPQHYHASLLEEMLRIDRFDYAFMVTRDPVARFRSEYLMRNHANPLIDAGSVDAWADRVFRAYDANPYALDNHLRPQHEFEASGVKVHRLEDGMDAVLADLQGQVGITLPKPKRQFLSSKAKAGVASSEVKISPALDQELRLRYAEDYRRYGY